jgi:hypothetical protein
LHPIHVGLAADDPLDDSFAQPGDDRKVQHGLSAGTLAHERAFCDEALEPYKVFALPCLHELLRVHSVWVALSSVHQAGAHGRRTHKSKEAQNVLGDANATIAV